MAQFTTQSTTAVFTVTEFCFHTGVSKNELNEIVNLGVIEPLERETQEWFFDDNAVTVMHRALKLHKELALDWHGIAIALTLLEENDQLKQDNKYLRQQLMRFISE
ncbi:MAG TPA: chaperone modulator CbpM [Proteus sp.]|uniref:Chaperone-modulator protein n=1 Tax=Proteus hauseri ATCC 700826 TaxID=1354271 RepID=A0AAJ3HT17_PROHU|nr:chaperone modulator CbpM [Proteus hauseri]OAT47493.1 chaperone-modulator protein [Proteus hauseri ATCC 700826]QAV24265.1 chaperone modulator CbpM [Proteus hauseri]HCH51723.1 chaperone modulator CbpM [Proteus sp. (in: enterobacteria)]